MPDNQGLPPDGQDGQDGSSDDGNAGAGFDYATWLEAQDEATAAGIEAHIGGLKRTVEATREDNKSLRQAVKDAAQGADGETKAQLDALGKKLEEREREVTFIDQAVAQKCRKPRALWVLAVADNAFDRYGKPDWQHLRSTYEELFETTPTPRGNAGAGAGTPPSGGPDMESLLRRAAGRG
jgi:hypothetical protein